MTRRRIASAVVAISLAAWLAGCSAPAIDSATGSALQDSVVAVAEQSAEGDNEAALAQLDELQSQLDAAIASDLITAARAARVQDAIDAVRADLEALVAPEPSPTPTEPADTGTDTSVDDSGGGGDSGSSGGGGGNENSGPGNNNGNDGGKGKDKGKG